MGRTLSRELRELRALRVSLVLAVAGCGSSPLVHPDGGAPSSRGAGSGGSPGSAAGGAPGSSAGGAPGSSAGGAPGAAGGAPGLPGAGGSVPRDAAVDLAPDLGTCICNGLAAAVCGVDGRTYLNTCAAKCAGVAVAYAGPCSDASAGRGACNSDSDCVFQRGDGCCGACLARGDTPMPSVTCNVACIAPPGGCSCVNHQCTRGTIALSAPCNLNQDACGNGLKCCIACIGGVAPPPDAASRCNQPVCTPVGTIGVCPPPPP